MRNATIGFQNPVIVTFHIENYQEYLFIGHWTVTSVLKLFYSNDPLYFINFTEYSRSWNANSQEIPRFSLDIGRLVSYSQEFELTMFISVDEFLSFSFHKSFIQYRIKRKAHSVFSVSIFLYNKIIVLYNGKVEWRQTCISVLTESKARIMGPADLYVKTGSSVTLACVICQGPHDLGTVFWYRGAAIIQQPVTITDQAQPQPRVVIETDWTDHLTSRLHISKARPSDSGNYTCIPTIAEPASVNVHVINGK